jgi:hypothetical protein
MNLLGCNRRDKETVETVSNATGVPITALKRGANETLQRGANEKSRIR